LEQDVDAEVANLCGHHGAGVGIQLAAEDPVASLNDLDLVITLQVHHGFGGFKTQQTASDDSTVGPFLACREGDELLEVIDGPVDKDAGCIGAGNDSGKDGIGAGGQDEDVVCYFCPVGTCDGFPCRVDFGDFVVEMVAESPVGDSVVLGIVSFGVNQQVGLGG
jgi:hypothetical protein